jgi:hypothetical protein
MCDYINIPNKPNMKELNQKLAIIQTKLKAKKSSYNSFGKYYFRKSEDILEAIKPFLMEQGVTVVINEEITSTDPFPILQSTATISDGENAIHATALVGVDLNQKGMQTSQQFGAASTYGKKYALAANQVITADQMSKAVEYISAGGDIKAIKSKYKLTAAQEKQLNGQKSNTTKA